MEKVAFISGANRGIGFETSKKLAEKGIKVILGSRDMDKGKKALEELAAQGIEADLIQYDAADLEAPQKIYDYIDVIIGYQFVHLLKKEEDKVQLMIEYVDDVITQQGEDQPPPLIAEESAPQ